MKENRIITVKDLKEWLDKLPEDAYIYDKLTMDGTITLISEQPHSNGIIKDEYKTWNFPKFMECAAINEDPIYWLKNFYNL